MLFDQLLFTYTGYSEMLKLILIFFGCLLGLSVAFVVLHPTFGGSPDKQSLQRISTSKNYNGDIFVNLIPTIMMTRSDKDPSMLEDLIDYVFNSNPDKNPNKALPTQPLNTPSIIDNSFTWLGHSTVLFKTGGKTLITDPIFHDASPLPYTVEAFKMTNTPKIEDLPELDVVLISHDHYDHLDYKGIQKIDAKVKHFYVPLGVKAHLQRWGVASGKITEMDWYESVNLGDVEIVFTPSRHFSGRGIWGRSKTLWGSWVVKSDELSVYFSGDGGYSPEFKVIGAKYGPFDIAFMEDGAYDKGWSQIHMTPEQAAQGAVDLNAKVLLPIHWGKFDLAKHKWTDPIERISQAVKGTDVTLATPMIGETFKLNQIPQNEWWNLSSSE